MRTFEEYPVGEAYLLSANGEKVGPAVLYQSADIFTVESVGWVKDVSRYEGRATKEGLELTAPETESKLLLSKISLSDAKTIFPDTIRKFKSVGSLSATIQKEIMKSNSYASTPEASETISITVDESGNVLELIRVDAEGELYFRDGGDWTVIEKDDEAPTIFDQSVIDIDLDDADRAIEYYDENVDTVDSISKEDMLEFAALVQ